MRVVRAIALALAAMALPVGAPAQEARYAGEWSGKYLCAQGVTAVRVVVLPTGGSGARAVVHFFASPENAKVPEGCFTLTGLFEPASGRLSLRQERWIVRPKNYNMADLDGTIDARGEGFSGRIANLKGCTSFTLTRAQAARPLPARCEAALR
jgi:hypothetical protein